ncbi:MAG: TonB-dependent receptor [bacterium]|nr:TonB-dependent receptor [bacterium]
MPKPPYFSLHGIEIEAKYRVKDHWFFMASYSYQTTKEPVRDIENYTFVPNTMLRFGLTYQLKNVFRLEYLTPISVPPPISRSGVPTARK